MKRANDSSIGLIKVFKQLVLIKVVSTSILSSPKPYNALNNVERRFESDNEFDRNETEVLEPDGIKAISKSKSIRTLEDIQKLQEDWNGYGAKPIPKSVLDLSRNIIMALDYQPEIFPTARRTVQMEYELDDNSYLEFEVYSDRITVMEVPNRDYSKAVTKIVPKDEYDKLASIVLRFHGGNDWWKMPIAV